ncbi:MAG: hypothetical protein PHN21_04065 [Erysipelotrichaceae bacterium]|nr:hypothetical protein [Erysipelotrichaceae bacterium]
MIKSEYKKYGSFISIFVISTLVYISNQMITTTIAKFANHLGAGSSLVRIVVGSFAMMALLIRPISGQAANNLNKKHLLLGSLLIILISTIGLSSATKINHLIIFEGLKGLIAAKCICITARNC